MTEASRRPRARSSRTSGTGSTPSGW